MAVIGAPTWQMFCGPIEVRQRQQQVSLLFHLFMVLILSLPLCWLCLPPRVLQGSDLEVDANICTEARMTNLEGLDESRELARCKSQ